MERFISWFAQQWAGTTATGKAALIGILVTMVAAIGILVSVATRPSYQSLFTNVSNADAGAITTRLDEIGIPYKASPDGTTISVPSQDVGRARNDIAAQGVIKGHVGYEAMRSIPMGATDAQITTFQKQAMEGELAKTFEALDPVSYADVKVTPGEEGLFATENRPASAAVIVRLRPGNRLTSRQIAGMMGLMKSSVSGLSDGNIRIMDTSMSLIAEGSDYGSGTSGSSFRIHEMEREQEKEEEATIKEQLDRTYPSDATNVIVNIEMDPVSVDIEKTVRTPAIPEGSAVVPPQQPDEQTTEESNNPDGSSTKSDTKRYGPPVLNEEHRKETRPAGQVLRRSVVVWLDNALLQPKPDPESEEAPKKLSPGELRKKQTEMIATVKPMAIGAVNLQVPPDPPIPGDTKTYPDRVEVAMMDFDRTQAEQMAADEAAAAGAARTETYKGYGRWIGLGVLLLLVLRWFAKAAARGLRAFEAPAGRQGAPGMPAAAVAGAGGGAVPGGDAGAAAPGAPRRPAETMEPLEEHVDQELERITRFAKDRPDSVALLLKSWLGESPRR